MSFNPFQGISKRRKIAQTNEAGQSITPDGLKQVRSIGSQILFFCSLIVSHCSLELIVSLRFIDTMFVGWDAAE
jgi:hypothetical protein